MPDVAAPGDWPPAAAKPPEPGEFTRMFQAPPAARPEAGPPPPKGGEYTEFFKPSPGGMPLGPQFPSASQFPAAPPPPAPPPPRQDPGEYTRMFGPGALSDAPPAVPAAQAPSPPASYGPGGGATQAFRVTPGSAPVATPQGPSEYTRMISVPSNLAAPPAAAPMPGMPRMGIPQMPAIPQQPVMPQMAYAPPPMPQMAPPQAMVPPATVPAPKSSNTLLIAIFCLLAFLAGAIVVYLLVRPR